MTKEQLHTYDKYLVQFSGGKDSIAAFLYLLEQGVPKEKIELWHQSVDGYPEITGSSTLMDWECTEDYCKKFGAAFGVPVYISYRDGGFRKEMLRNDTRTGHVVWETPTGWAEYRGTRSKPNTRMQFPQVSADLSCRWCSSYLKIDVATIALRNQQRFNNSRTLVLSGERAEESSARALYAKFEPDRADKRTSPKLHRHVDRLRPVHAWTEPEIWDLIRNYKIQVHPCYYLGYSRCSCKFCIFGNADQFTSSQVLSPDIFRQIVEFETYFGKSIKRKEWIVDLVKKRMPISRYFSKSRISNTGCNI